MRLMGQSMLKKVIILQKNQLVGLVATACYLGQSCLQIQDCSVESNHLVTQIEFQHCYCCQTELQYPHHSSIAVDSLIHCSEAPLTHLIIESGEKRLIEPVLDSSNATNWEGKCQIAEVTDCLVTVD